MGFGKDGKGTIIYDQVSGADLGALAAVDLTAIAGNQFGATIEDFRVLKMDYHVAISPAAAITVANGPLLFGVASGHLLASEIEECIESVLLNRGGIPEGEQAMRPVWPLETFIIHDPDQGPQSDLTRDGSFNPRWTFTNPDGWRYWVYNMSSFVITTGSLLSAITKSYGVWV